MQKILFYLSWVINCRIGNQKIPIVNSLIITDICYLSCQHCGGATTVETYVIEKLYPSVLLENLKFF